MKSFTKGFAAGATALAVGVPLMAQMALAASADQAVSQAADAQDRPSPSQPCTEAMAHLASAHVDVFDEMNKTRKEKMIVHRDALVAAAAIADDAQRAEALKSAHEAMKPTEERTIPAAIQTAMDAVKAACGDTMMFKGRHGGMGGHGGPFMMKMKRGAFERGQSTEDASAF